MSTDAHTPVPLRPSAEERERVVRLLRDRSVEGRLSTDTFADRVGLALQARTGAELADLTSDVRPGSRPRRLFLTAVEWLSRLDADIQAAWSRPRVPGLELPADDGARRVVGRAADCDCLLGDDRVSRRHAELWREGEPGDRLDLGGAQYRLSRARTPRPRPL